MKTINPFELNAQVRIQMGKGASRRLRRTGMVPAIVYGTGKESLSITLNHNELIKRLENEAFYSHILTINIDGQPERAVLKDLQRHPYRRLIMHLDLQRISETEQLYIQIPLHFLNEDKCVGIKDGGMFERQMIEVEVRCLPKDLPEFIGVDLSNLKIGDVVHLSDLVVPPGVEIVALIQGSNYAVASVKMPRGEEDRPAVGNVANIAAPEAKAAGTPEKKESGTKK